MSRVLLLLAVLGCTTPLEGCHLRGAPDAQVDGDVAASDLAHRIFDLSEPDMARAVPDLAIADAVIDMAQAPDLETGPDASVTDGGASVDLACNLACNTPPPPACQGNNVVLYFAPGTCAMNSCQYAPKMTGCAMCDPMVLCGPLNYLGTTTGSFNGNKVTFQKNTPANIPAGTSIMVETQTAQHAAAASVQLFYATDAQYKTQMNVVMQFETFFNSNDVWAAMIPGLPAGTHVWFYIRADGRNAGTLYDPQGGIGNNFEFVTQ